MTRRLGPRDHEIAAAATDPRYLLAVAAKNKPYRKWWHLSACLGKDVEEFFPDTNDHAAAEWALLSCRECDVMGHCLADALDRGDLHSVTGGTTWQERRAMLPLWPPYRRAAS